MEKPPINPDQQKINILRDQLKEIFDKNYSTLGHGTNESSAKQIMEEGLGAFRGELDSTTIPLFDHDKTYAEQSDEPFQEILNWRHRNYKYIVIVMVPNPSQEQSGGRHYFDSVYEELSSNEIKTTGFSELDRNYVIPPKFIKGYIDVDNLELIKNPIYDPSAKVIVKSRPNRLVPGKRDLDTKTEIKIETPEASNNETDIW